MRECTFSLHAIVYISCNALTHIHTLNTVNTRGTIIYEEICVRLAMTLRVILTIHGQHEHKRKTKQASHSLHTSYTCVHMDTQEMWNDNHVFSSVVPIF